MTLSTRAIARSIVAAGCALVQAANGQTPTAPPAAELVLRGGAVFTADASNPTATAVAVRGGRIVYVGNDEGVARFVGTATRTIEIGDGMVLPASTIRTCTSPRAAWGSRAATCPETTRRLPSRHTSRHAPATIRRPRG